MGHSELKTTQIYAKVEVEHLRAALSHLEPLLPVLDVSGICVTPARKETKALPKPSSKKTCGIDFGIGGEGGIPPGQRPKASKKRRT
jgi:hypothetical protein